MITTKILAVLMSISLPILTQGSHMHPGIRHGSQTIEGRKVNQKVESPQEAISRQIRLPLAWTPISYFIRIKPYINGDKSIEGYTEIIFTADDPASNITLHMMEIFDYETSIMLFPADDPTDIYPFTEHTHDPVSDFYIGYFERPLTVGTTYKISMDFASTINNLLSGFYLSTYVNKEGETINLASTHMQPNNARRAFPCFDDPAWKATFQIEMGRQENLTAISNMPVLSSTPMEDEPGWVWDLFDVSPKMSSYLVAFTVSDFVSISSYSGNDILFTIWAREAVIGQGAYALDIGPRMLTYFEDYYAVPYPLPKQDMIALPDFEAGAMENWGLITYRETALLYDTSLSSAANKELVILVISHELAHMWFGDLVSMKWWNDLWLNEGFARYVQYLGADYVEPSMDMQTMFLVRDMQPIFQADSLLTSHPLRQDVTTLEEIENLFDGITYDKGAAVIRMMNFFLTEDTFRRGLTRYLKELAYGSAEQDDLFRNLDIQAKLDGNLADDMNVKDIMDTWTLQEGFPVITVKIYGNGTALLTQERYLQNPNKTGAQFTYWVPITHTSGNSNPDFSKTYPSDWMSPSDSQVIISGLTIDDDWYIFNVQEVSFYRVNYDESNWRALRDQLKSAHEVIDVRNRAQIIDDSFNLALSGHLIYDIPFEISSYLLNEAHYVPWKAALTGVAHIEKMFTRTSGYTGLKEYLQSLISPIYSSVGFEDSLDDLHVKQLLRSNIVSWACDLRIKSCLDSATSLFAKWMQTPNDYTVVSPNVKSGVYCTAVAEGGDAEWNFAWNRFITTEYSTEVDYLLHALGCSKDIPTLSAYLDSAFQPDGDIRLQDISKVFDSVASNDVGRDVAWDYLVNNYRAIVKLFGGSYIELQTMAATVCSEFNTWKDLTEINGFKDILQLTENVQNVDLLNGAIERVENNIAWMNNNYADITTWLADNGYDNK